MNRNLEKFCNFCYNLNNELYKDESEHWFWNLKIFSLLMTQKRYLFLISLIFFKGREYACIRMNDRQLLFIKGIAIFSKKCKWYVFVSLMIALVCKARNIDILTFFETLVDCYNYTIDGNFFWKNHTIGTYENIIDYFALLIATPSYVINNEYLLLSDERLNPLKFMLLGSSIMRLNNTARSNEKIRIQNFLMKNIETNFSNEYDDLQKLCEHIELILFFLEKNISRI